VPRRPTYSAGNGSAAGIISRNLRESVGIFIASGAFVMICANALFMQAGPHPAPIFAPKANPAPVAARQPAYTPPAPPPRIGEAFFQARASYDRRHAGTGLGLSIVNGLVRLHGGSTDISSKPGEGTRVTVRLPLNCEDKPPAARPITLERRTNAAPERADSIQVRKSA
jgi:hypothetical protein